MIEKEARNWGMLCHLGAFAGFIFPFGNIIIPLIISFIFFSAPARAEKIAAPENYGTSYLDYQKTLASEESLLSPHQFKLSFETAHFDYQEGDQIKEEGFLFGLKGDYRYHRRNRLMVGLSLEYLIGDLDYEGKSWGGTPVKADLDEWRLECRALVGYDHLFQGKQLLTPFLGFDYRYWEDALLGKGGYGREVEYWYLPLGIRMVNPVSGKWSLSIEAEYDLFWKGKVKSRLSEVSPALNDPEVNQGFGEGYGLRLSFPLEKMLGGRYFLSLAPYFCYWSIEESDREILRSSGVPVGSVYEPKNKTIDYGFNFGIGF